MVQVSAGFFHRISVSTPGRSRGISARLHTYWQLGCPYLRPELPTTLRQVFNLTTVSAGDHRADCERVFLFLERLILCFQPIVITSAGQTHHHLDAGRYKTAQRTWLPICYSTHVAHHLESAPVHLFPPLVRISLNLPSKTRSVYTFSSWLLGHRF